MSTYILSLIISVVTIIFSIRLFIRKETSGAIELEKRLTRLEVLVETILKQLTNNEKEY